MTTNGNNISDKWQQEAEKIVDDMTGENRFVHDEPEGWIDSIAQALSDAFKQGLEQRVSVGKASEAEIEQSYADYCMEQMRKPHGLTDPLPGPWITYREGFLKAQSLAGDAWPSVDAIKDAKLSYAAVLWEQNSHSVGECSIAKHGFLAGVEWLRDWKSRAR